jgi:RND family efflux transporter MFP subunit
MRTWTPLAFALIALIALVAPGLPARAEEPPAGPPPAPVEVAPVVKERYAAGRTFVGSVAPSKESVVGSEFGGLVVSFLAREGQRVAEKQPLAELSSAILDERIAAARAERDLRQQELAELEAGSRAEEIAGGRARLKSAEIDIESRRWKLEAAKRLFDGKNISEDELRDARLTLESAEAARDDAAASLALLEAGPRQERIEQARARLKAQEAELARLEEERRRYVIRAPFDGYVLEELTEVGQWLNPGSPVARVAALDEVDFVVPILEDYVSGLPRDLEVQVRLNALPALSLTQARARLFAIVPQADERGRTFPVKFRLANTRVGDDVLVKAGMFGSVTLPVEAEREMLLVPKDAIVLGGPQPLVYVANADGSVIPVPVTLGVSKGDQVQVLGRLEAGQQVVTKGNERIFPGMRVRPVEGGR